MIHCAYLKQGFIVINLAIPWSATQLKEKLKTSILWMNIIQSLNSWKYVLAGSLLIFLRFIVIHFVLRLESVCHHRKLGNFNSGKICTLWSIIRSESTTYHLVDSTSAILINRAKQSDITAQRTQSRIDTAVNVTCAFAFISGA